MMGAGILLFAAGTAAALAAGAYLYMKGLMSIGTAYLVFAYTELMRAPLEQIRTQIQDLQRAGASIARIESLVGIRSRTRESDACRRLAAGALAVEFDKVSFAYEDEQQMVLREVSFSLTPGRVLGILGRTGSGKTTIARLLFRLYDPSSGEIRLDGIPAWEAGLTDLRQRIGMVTQDVELFHASVRDNLTFFRRSIPDERILAVLLEVGLGGWYASLPAGLDTVIGSNGGGLSAGEAQLLAFARLFLTEPGLVVMDEASSRLDPVTESLLERAVDRALHGRTGIIIAHRLGTIQRVDDVLILEDGRVLEYGEREQLAQNPSSHFYRLLKTGLEEVLA
jgi:ABC-type multidrug transport system fused ATPase/permease subunit